MALRAQLEQVNAGRTSISVEEVEEETVLAANNRRGDRFQWVNIQWEQVSESAKSTRFIIIFFATTAPTRRVIMMGAAEERRIETFGIYVRFGNLVLKNWQRSGTVVRSNDVDSADASVSLKLF